MKTTLLSGMILMAVCGMAQAAPEQHDMSQHDMSNHQMAMQNAARHEGAGVLKAINAQAGKVQIAHEPIASLNWPAMTMWFTLHTPMPADIKVGDRVRFELEQTHGNQWDISKIERR